MATRLYVTKYTDTGDDIVEAKQDFEALDYVDAMREGSAYGSEIYNLRDDLVSLKDYVQRYDALGDSGKVLYLNHSPGAGDAPAGSYVPKRFALLCSAATNKAGRTILPKCWPIYAPTQHGAFSRKSGRATGSMRRTCLRHSWRRSSARIIASSW